MPQELQFAHQNGVPIIPVMMAGDGWRASGWLGLLTAGALWTSLYDESTFDDNVQAVRGQIQQIMESDSVEDNSAENVEDGSLSPNEATEELARLRDDLTVTSQTHTSAPAIVSHDPLHPATLSAGVPKLPPRFRATEQIEELTRLVLSTSATDLARSRVGFYGM